MMICTGQRSAASMTHESRSAGAFPSAIFPPERNFSITWLNASSGFSSKNAGQVSQQVPQLVQLERSIPTFMISPHTGQRSPAPARDSFSRCGRIGHRLLAGSCLHVYEPVFPARHFGQTPSYGNGSNSVPGCITHFFYTRPGPGNLQACPGIRSIQPSSGHAYLRRGCRHAAG